MRFLWIYFKILESSVRNSQWSLLDLGKHRSMWP